MAKYIKHLFILMCSLLTVFIIFNIILNKILASFMISNTLYLKKYSLYNNQIILCCEANVLDDSEARDIVHFFDSISNNFVFNKTKCYNINMVDSANHGLLSAKFLEINGHYYINELSSSGRFILSPDFINELNTQELKILKYVGTKIKNNFAFLDQCPELKELCIDSHETISDIDLLLIFKKINTLEYFRVVLYDDPKNNNDEQNNYIIQLHKKLTEINPDCKIVIWYSK